MIEIPFAAVAELPWPVIVKIEEQSVKALVAEHIVNVGRKHKMLAERVVQFNSGSGGVVERGIAGLDTKRFATFGKLCRHVLSCYGRQEKYGDECDDFCFHVE